MKKPIVLRRRLRLFDWHNGAVVLITALWAWQYSHSAAAAWILLPALIFNIGNVFSRRVALASDRITIYGMAICGNSHRFERIINYSITESKGNIDVEVMLQQKSKGNIEIFGTEFNLNWRPQNSSDNKERIVSFSVEPEQWDALLNYLRAHGAVVDEIAAMWKENDFSSRVRALTKRDDLSEEEAAELLREIEERLTRLNKPKLPPIPALSF